MIDDLDQNMLSLLRRDPRLANKAMASALGVSESTIGTRLERLSAQNIARVIGQRDYRSGGSWKVSALLEIETNDAGSAALIDRLSAHDRVVTIYELSGRPELLIKIVAEDLDALTVLAHGVIGTDPSVDAIAVHVCLRHGFVRQGFGNLDTPQPPAATSGDVTQTILDILGRDGRISNREIARSLNMAEATVRARVRKLIEDKALRYMLVLDPAKAGYSALAFASVRVPSAQIDQAVARMSSIAEVFGVTVISGSRNLLLSIFSPTWERTLEVFEQICHIFPGESDPQLRPAKRFARHRFQLAFTQES